MIIVFILLAVIFFILWRNSCEKAKKQATGDASLIESLRKRVGELIDRAADAESQVAKMKAEEKEKAAKAKATQDAADRALEKAEAEAANNIAIAAETANSIVADAEAKAKEIAGSAYEAKEKADTYKELITSLKNTIDGYGDEWLKPTYTLLDELADSFGYTEAGQNLNKARRKTALMIRYGRAAVCESPKDDNTKSSGGRIGSILSMVKKSGSGKVEAEPEGPSEEELNKAAVNFIVDAFNGKVDSILSRVKKDNYGKLERQIKDAYNLVNMSGEICRGAKITVSYLNARLEELKWAVVCSELKAKEKEEQKRLREEMREEEKARREYERAQREAEKEEEMLLRAMEKARAAMEKASEEQKAYYEDKMEELNQQLEEAREKGQRALSMAQQTKQGCVYVISNIGSFGENVYKVGMTRRLTPEERIKELGDASVPFPFDIHAKIKSDNAPALETELHKALAMAQVNKVNPRKEFFRITLEEIKAIVDEKGIKADWTMTAAATEYRESLAIEASIKDDVDARKRWERAVTVSVEDAPEDLAPDIDEEDE